MKTTPPHESLKLKGHLDVYVRELGQTEWKLHDSVDNLITYGGLNHMLNTMTNVANTNYYGYFAISNSTAAVSASNTTLPGEISRKAIDSATAYTATRKVTIISSLTFAEGNGYVISKYALFDAATVGNMWNETNLNTTITKTTLLQVEFQYTVAAV